MVGFAVLRRVAFRIRETGPILATELSRSSSGNSSPVSSLILLSRASTVEVWVIGNSCEPRSVTALAIRVTALSSLIIEP